MELEWIVVLGSAVGGLISWALANVPLARSAFSQLDRNQKALTLVGFCLLAGVFFAGEQVDVGNSLLAFVSALAGTQVNYNLAVKGK